MSPQPLKSPLTVEALIALFEEQRCTFTDRYRPLTNTQETALQKANRLISENVESLKQNSNRKKAWRIMNDIEKCISREVFVLCALAVTISALGFSKLGDYRTKIDDWWEGVHHPIGLSEVAARLLRTSKNNDLAVEKVSARSGSPTSGFEPQSSVAIQPPVQLIEDSTSQIIQHNQLPDDDSIRNERLPKRSRLESPQFPVNPVLPVQGDYCTFAFMSRHMIQEIPEPFRTAIKTSKLWRQEKESRGLEVTNCVTFDFPETYNEDVIVKFRINYKSGFDMSNQFGIGDPKIIRPELESHPHSQAS